MPVSLLKAPSVSAADSTGYYVHIPEHSERANVQSVQDYWPGWVAVHFHDCLGFGTAYLSPTARLTLCEDQGPTAAFLA